MNIKIYIFAGFLGFGLVSCGDLLDGGSDDSKEAEAETNDGDDSDDLIETSLTYKNFAKEVIDEHCAYCHKVPASKGAPNLFRLDSYETKENFPGVKAMLAKSLEAVEKGTMPPVVESSLTKEQREKLIEWYKGGAPKGGDVADGGEEAGGDLFIAVGSPSFEGDTPTADVYTVNVTLNNVTSDTGWTIYSTAVKGETNGGTVIASGLDLGTTSYDWDMSGVADGTYYIYMQVLTSSGIKRAASAGSVVKSP